MTPLVAVAMIEVQRLWNAGLTPIPLCRPAGPLGRCTASWHEVPCPRIGKTHLVKGYLQFALRRPSPDELGAHFLRRSACNIGIVTGRGTIAIEADSPEAEREVVELAGSALDHRRSRQGSGR
jgi:hypothetical protein